MTINEIFVSIITSPNMLLSSSSNQISENMHDYMKVTMSLFSFYVVGTVLPVLRYINNNIISMILMM